MNKIEEFKQERDGLEIKDAIAEYARTGWESISEGDIQRLERDIENRSQQRKAS